MPYCEDLLARHLDDDEPDVVRLCIESLGFLGAETWAHRIEELLYSFISPPFDQARTIRWALAHCVADAARGSPRWPPGRCPLVGGAARRWRAWGCWWGGIGSPVSAVAGWPAARRRGSAPPRSGRAALAW